MRTLLSVCAVVAALLAVAAVALGCCAHPHRCPAVPEQVLLAPCDKPLMTAEERAWARQSGIGTYVWAASP